MFSYQIGRFAGGTFLGQKYHSVSGLFDIHISPHAGCCGAGPVAGSFLGADWWSISSSSSHCLSDFKLTDMWCSYSENSPSSSSSKPLSLQKWISNLYPAPNFQFTLNNHSRNLFLWFMFYGKHQLKRNITFCSHAAVAWKRRRKNTVLDSSPSHSASCCPPLKNIGTDAGEEPLTHGGSSDCHDAQSDGGKINNFAWIFINFLPQLFSPTLQLSLLLPPQWVTLFPLSPRCMVQQWHLWCADRRFHRV